jgi:hypothetical protein
MSAAGRPSLWEDPPRQPAYFTLGPRSFRRPRRPRRRFELPLANFPFSKTIVFRPRFTMLAVARPL